MNLKFFHSWSIKSRVTLSTLAIFVCSIWTISFYVSRALQEDMQRVLGEQHFQTTSMVADEINTHVQDRLNALEVIAQSLGPAIAGGAAATREVLENRPVFQGLFNSGSFVTGMDGTAIASFPVSAGLTGINFIDRDHVATALKEGRSSVSKPMISKVFNKPVFAMAVPIRDPQGKVIGALIGSTDLGETNFLDKIAKASFNKTGVVSVIASQYRVTVASSDKSFVMQALPPPGVNPYLDRNIAGFEGYTTVVNVLGQKQLASVKKIPAAQWYLYSGLPIEDVFAPVRAMQQRVLLAAIVLTMLAGAFTWLLLKRQLSPILDTASKLVRMAESVETALPLPVTRQDEIGQLISGFNRLLENFQKQGLVLRQSERNYQRIVENSPDIVYMFSMTKGSIYYSPTVLAVLGYRAEQLLANPFMWAESIFPDDRPLVAEAIDALKNGTPFRIEYRIKDSKGEWHWLFDRSTSVLEEDGDVVVEGLAMDITERKAAEQQIQTLAFSDPLTGLPNRRLLMDRLKQAMVGAVRHGQHDALMFVDMDNFKTLNDSLGHDKGDQLLKQIAQRVLTSVREGDTVARLGGDEFVVLLEDLDKSPQEAATQAEAVGSKIHKALRQPYQLGTHGYHSSASIGVTLFGGGQRESIEEPLKRAELAMYKAKAVGRDNLRFYEPEMGSAINARANLEADLHKAVAQAQFLLYYQAQVDRDGHLTGVEALVRWQHPERGLVSPADFIPVAEANGLILPLGHWILETACRQLAAWALRPEMAHLTISVNVSARQFRSPDFVEQVLAVLEATAANPKRLKLELTESLLLDNMKDIITKMNALKSCGVGFSLDDFGTGYSSLSYLKRLPLDQLKIDQSFVRNILVDPNDAAIAKMVIALADSLGLQVIAEGVEAEAQRDFLAGLGCHHYQGYLFSRPLPLEEFESFAKRVIRFDQSCRPLAVIESL